jgi:hypothetical protein
VVELSKRFWTSIVNLNRKKQEKLMARIILLSALVILFFAGCKEEEQPQVDAFIFGRWNLLCEGNCIQIYKYDQGKLYIDNMRSFREAPVITYKTTPLDNSSATKAANLRTALPEAYLFPRALQFIACAGCEEEGGYYVALENKDGIAWWQIGKVPETWPEEIKPFMNLLVQTIDELPQE